jgi:predicted nucleic acid-binding protein
LIYVDTSVLVAMLTNERTTHAVRHWYGADNNRIFITSDWVLSEFSSAISLKERTRQISPKQAGTINKSFDIFMDGGIKLVEVSRPAFRNSAKLIQAMPGLRAGDALHLAVALELGVSEFATLDKLLLEKAAMVNLNPAKLN